MDWRLRLLGILVGFRTEVLCNQHNGVFKQSLVMVVNKRLSDQLDEMESESKSCLIMMCNQELAYIMDKWPDKSSNPLYPVMSGDKHSCEYAFYNHCTWNGPYGVNNMNLLNFVIASLEADVYCVCTCSGKSRLVYDRIKVVEETNCDCTNK